jgi:hypothetical protein
MRRASKLLRTCLLLLAGCREPPRDRGELIPPCSVTAGVEVMPPVVIECDERGEDCHTVTARRSPGGGTDRPPSEEARDGQLPVR